MEPLIRDLTIERYRALRHLTIAGLGRVNLITGRNNSGKSSLLEALRILAHNAAPSVLYDILRFREEDNPDSPDAARAVESDAVFDFSNLFYGFPSFSIDAQPIRIVATGSQQMMTVGIAMAWITENGEAVTPPGRLAETHELYYLNDAEVFPALAVEIDGVSKTRSLESLQRFARSRLPRPGWFSERRLPCSFVSAYSGEQTAPLRKQWDAIALTDLEHDVVNALKIIDPKISAVTMVSGETYPKDNFAKVRQIDLPHPVPLRTFGDGINRVFGIILGLVNAKGGLLLVDEVENGLHYSVQHELWKLIFRLSRELNVQVFATTHSWDMIEAFQRAASETPEEGALARLIRNGEDQIATVFNEEDLGIVTRDRLEVR